MPIVTRAVKGLPLTHLEMDNNFIELKSLSDAQQIEIDLKVSKPIIGSLLDTFTTHVLGPIPNPMLLNTKCLLFQVDLTDSTPINLVASNNYTFVFALEKLGFYDEWGDVGFPSFYYHPTFTCKVSIAYVSAGVYNVTALANSFPNSIVLDSIADGFIGTFDSTTRILSLYLKQTYSDSTALNVVDNFKISYPASLYSGKFEFIIPTTFEYVAI